MKVFLLGLLSLLLILPLAAQIDLPRPSFNPYQSGGSSLLDLNRISMNHSMGFSAGVSSAGSGYYLSRYTNHLKYSFNPKLDLELDLNFVNFGSTNSSFEFNADNRSRVIPEFKLNYRPSESVQLQIEFRQGNPWMQDYKPWPERW
ncbi:MAG: hypothetical protein K0B87_06425 [Candidatus Syntrophosphaera sp.]|nr:hypothetical protein [Candidatus Syntrophosphaera sp.]